MEYLYRDVFLYIRVVVHPDYELGFFDEDMAGLDRISISMRDNEGNRVSSAL